MINVGPRVIYYCAGVLGLTICAVNVHIAAPVFASVTPEVYVTGATLEKTVFSAGQEIGGAVSVQNSEPYFSADTHFAYYLLSRGDNQRVIDYRKGDAFTLGPGEARDLRFGYWLPFKLPAEPFIFRIGVENGRGSLVAWIDRAIRISSGDGPFYYISHNAASGAVGPVSVGAGSDVNVKIDGQADDSEPSVPALVMRVTTYRSGIQWDVREQELGRVSWPSVVSMALPAFDAPGLYRADARIYNRGSGDAYSNLIQYFWQVQDTNARSARILYTLIDKTDYAAGDRARVKVQIAYPSWAEGAPPYVFCRLTGESGAVAEMQKTASPFESEMILDVPVTATVSNPTVFVAVRDEGTILDSYEFAARGQKSVEAAVPASESTPDITAALEAARMKTTIFSVILAISLSGLLVGGAVVGRKVILPRIVKRKPEAPPRPKKNGEDDSISDLLREFNEIDKENKKFKYKNPGQ